MAGKSVSVYGFDGCTKTIVNFLVLLTQTGRTRIIKPLAVDVHPCSDDRKDSAKMLKSGD